MTDKADILNNLPVALGHRIDAILQFSDVIFTYYII